MRHSEEQLEEMRKEVEAVADLMKATEAIIKSEMESPSEPVDNVIYMDPTVYREYEQIKDKPTKLPEMVSAFHRWAEKTFEAAERNRGRFQNNKVMEHVGGNLAIVQLITNLLPKSPDDAGNS